MEEKLVFKNNPFSLAKEFATVYTSIRDGWKESSRYGEAKVLLQKGVLEMDPTQKIIWDIRVVGRVPHVTAVVSEAISDPSFEQPHRWNEKPELVRSLLRIAVNMDLGDWRAIDVDRSMGGEVHKSDETIALEKFLERLEEKVTPSFGENRIS